MSKELEIIKNRNEKIKSNHMIGNRRIANEELKECSIAIENAILEIEESLTPPTADEVCEELHHYFPHKVTFNKERYSFESYTDFGTTFTICQLHENNTISWNDTCKLKLKSIIKIGRFFEGKVKDE